MDANNWFLRRCDQVAGLMDSADEGDLADLAGRIRQLMFDGSASLVDKVNSNKVPLRFEVGTFAFEPDNLSIMSLEDGFDPATARLGKPTKSLTREEYNAYPVIYFGKNPVTVREVVRYAALVHGGVHFDDDPRDEFLAMSYAATKFGVGDLPFGIRGLMAIGRVTIKGLEPLITDVRSRVN